MALIWGTQERMMLSFFIEASRLVMVLITEMGNMRKMNQFGREKNQEFCICSVEFQLPKKRLRILFISCCLGEGSEL